MTSSSVWDIALIAFWAAVAVGILARGMRAKRRRFKTAIKPVADAADAYQDLLLSRPNAPVRYGRDGPISYSLIVDAAYDGLLDQPQKG